MDNRPWDLTILKYFIKHATAVYSLAVLYAVSSFNMPEACHEEDTGRQPGEWRQEGEKA